MSLLNKVGIYFAYWTSEWDADYMYYLDKVSALGFDIQEVASAHILEMSETKRMELKKAAQDRDMELTYCIGFAQDKDMASEAAMSCMCSSCSEGGSWLSGIHSFK